MKQSKRLLIGTILGLYGVMMIHTALSRVFVDETQDGPVELRRTSAEQLATLRDFDEVDAQGDFSLELVQQANYSVEVIRAADAPGELVARVTSGVLQLRGYGNPASVRVRIGTPQLEDLETDFAPLLSISGFTSDSLDIQVGTRSGTDQRVELRNNDIEDLRLRIFDMTNSVEVQIDRRSFGDGIDIAGSARVTILE